MALSGTAFRVLTEAGQHPLRLAMPPKHLPAAACNAVLRSLLKGDYVEECPAPFEYIGLGRRQQDGAWTALQVTDAGLLAIGTAPSEAPKEAQSGPPTAFSGPEGQQAPDAVETASVAATAPPAPTTRASLRHAAQRVLSAWDDEPNQRADLPDAMAVLRRLVIKPASGDRTAGPRKPREGTKQQQVLAMLRRPEGASVAQIAETTGWQPHTVRGFFAGLKKRHGIAVDAAERVRQVGAGKESAKGSYTIYRVSDVAQG
jgi:hypothetical protein